MEQPKVIGEWTVRILQAVPDAPVVELEVSAAGLPGAPPTVVLAMPLDVRNTYARIGHPAMPDGLAAALLVLRQHIESALPGLYGDVIAPVGSAARTPGRGPLRGV